MNQKTFDADYYRRFYLDPKTQVRDISRPSPLSQYIFGFLGHFDIPVRRVLDLGCGLGQWKGELAKVNPKAQYTGVEYSPYLCEQFGWVQGSASNFQGRGQYDLVICQSVFQYLTDSEAIAGIANLARLCRGAVYLEIITAHDWKNNCDQDVTDGKVFLRTGAWYRKYLNRYFKNIGGGIFLPITSNVIFYELENAGL